MAPPLVYRKILMKRRFRQWQPCVYTVHQKMLHIVPDDKAKPARLIKYQEIQKLEVKPSRKHLARGSNSKLHLTTKQDRIVLKAAPDEDEALKHLIRQINAALADNRLLRLVDNNDDSDNETHSSCQEKEEEEEQQEISADERMGNKEHPCVRINCGPPVTSFLDPSCDTVLVQKSAVLDLLAAGEIELNRDAQTTRLQILDGASSFLIQVQGTVKLNLEINGESIKQVQCEIVQSLPYEVIIGKSLLSNSRTNGFHKQSSTELSKEPQPHASNVSIDSSSHGAIQMQPVADQKGVWTTIKDFIAFVVARPKPSYQIVSELKDNEASLVLHLDPTICGEGILEWQLWFHPFLISTWPMTLRDETLKIACVYVHRFDNPNFVLLHSHANGSDVGRELSDCLRMAEAFRCDVLSYDYTGYGSSYGHASETAMYESAEAAWQFLTDELGYPQSKIVLYGHSIGTAATIDLASRYEPAGIILNAPFTSGYRTLLPCLCCTLPGDSLLNIDKVHALRSPTLFVHGTRDKRFGTGHSKRLMRFCPAAAKPLWIERGGHMDCQQKEEFFIGVRKFLCEDAGIEEKNISDEV